MKAEPLFVKQIWQVDRHRFAIEWDDAKVQVFQLAQLQKQCPCAACASAGSITLNKNVGCSSIESVGRFGLRVHYTTGCSFGIYSFVYLRKLGAPYANKTTVD